MIYPKIHKIHHENQFVYSLAAISSHPLEFVFGNVIPMMVGPTILAHRMHRSSVFGWFMVRAAETIDAHCGFDFSWSPFRLLPFQLEGDYHYFHHSSNVGNYATFFTWWDTILGTNSAFYKGGD
jgi:sterol desaturase/sphingolipid hydroxylase (fatty acid hydroxylase superfamily)